MSKQMKLFPPLINNIIPAFYSDNRVVAITIPFSMNRVVGAIQVKGFAMKIKTVQSSNYLFTATTLDENRIFTWDMEGNPFVTFYLNESEVKKLREKQFYKIQLAYINQDNEVGYYSSVATTKFTYKPEVVINDFSEDTDLQNTIHTHTYKYTGFYTCADPTERVYSYEFNVYDANNVLIDSSGEQIHDSQNDEDLSNTYDTFMLSQELELNKIYRIQYIVNTTNGMRVSSPRYRIAQKVTIDPEIQAELKAELNYEEGYIKISLVGLIDKEGLEIPATGSFLITRASEDTNFQQWDEIVRFKLAGDFPSRLLTLDHTIEQGKKYKYSLQQYNSKGLFSNRIYSNEVNADFEYAFLYDGKRQLKIKYNPKVSSFKANALEQKIDTIGSKHPFIFRNGRVYYREFPISGLISYLMDEENLFVDENKYSTEEKTTNLVSDNIAKERIFKIEVLAWLTNGEPKLFRSPTEGNFIVRLMNVSMTPNDTLGRMLHTFNCTAYEVADYNYDNLGTYGFIETDPEEPEKVRWMTTPLFEIKDGKIEYKTGKVNRHIVYTLRLIDMTPGDIITLVFDKVGAKPQEIKIGATGSYYVDCGVAIREVIINAPCQGSMTYSYKSIQENVFDKVDNVTISEMPVRQFFGEHDIITEIECIQDNTGKWVKNPKVDIVEIYGIDVERRDIQQITYDADTEQYYTDPYKKNPLIDFDIYKVYSVGEWVNEQSAGADNPGYAPSRPNWIFKESYYLDPSQPENESDTYEPLFYFNNSPVSILETRTFDFLVRDKVESIKSANGVITNIGYQLRTIDYLIEDSEEWLVKPKKEAYLQAVEEFDSYLEKGFIDTESENELLSLSQKVKDTYKEYILILIEEIERQKEAEGLLS